MGVVYKARQKHLDRLVALKILAPWVGKDPAFAERFAQARALAMLSHPNIVAVHDFGQTDDLFYFLMEFVDGVSLRQLLDTGKLDRRGAGHRAADLRRPPVRPRPRHRAPRHQAGEHPAGQAGPGEDRRLRPGEAGEPEGGGLALTGAGQVMGTPQYMAPEQVDRPREVDHRADIYSLGVVFYQMLTGELPRAALPRLRRKCKSMCGWTKWCCALEQEPEHRYQQASEIEARWRSSARPPR